MTDESLADPEASDTARSGIDTTVPHSARIWNYWLGGKDNFAVDRAAGDAWETTFPGMRDIARASRSFLTRSIAYLAQDAGIRQFLDVGTGLPTENNTHEVAQKVAPESRVVYVDNDPIVLSHARALLTSDPRGRCTYVDADARQVEKILTEAAQTLDFSQPVAVMVLGLLHFIPDADDPYELTRRFMAAVPSGSYLAISHGSSDLKTETQTAGRSYNAHSATPITFRSRQEVTRFFSGLELVPPGVSPLGQWSLGPTGTGSAQLPTYAALARKP